jgi:aminoglycoside phosphotransferase (APT) family kinase protein
MTETELRERLEAFIGVSAGGAARVEAVRPLAGGASLESLAVDVTISGGPEAGRHALVLRMDQASRMNPEALDRAGEFALLRAADEAGVLVPRPRWLEPTGAVLGRPFLLMERIAGETIGARIVRRPELAAARAALPRQMAQQLARIHAINPTGLSFLPRPPNGMTPAAHAMAQMRALIDRLHIASPALEFGLRWLAAHEPPPVPSVLVHGDFRIGNLMVGPEGLRAVLDWEFAHLGDPHEDLAWPTVRDWRFGNDALPVGGVGELEPYLAAYEAASGWRVNRSAVRFWEILGNLRWAATCRSQAQRHLSGADPSVELASLGRRAAEMELEFLTLIEHANEQKDP